MYQLKKKKFKEQNANQRAFHLIYCFDGSFMDFAIKS